MTMTTQTKNHTIPFQVTREACLRALGRAVRMAKDDRLSCAVDWLNLADRIAGLEPALVTHLASRFAEARAEVKRMRKDTSIVEEMNKWTRLVDSGQARRIYCPDNEELIRAMCSSWGWGAVDVEAAHLIAAMTGGPIGLVAYYKSEAGYDIAEITRRVRLYLDSFPEDLRDGAQAMWDECGWLN